MHKLTSFADDVLAVQVHGKKTWRVFRTPDDFPVLPLDSHIPLTWKRFVEKHGGQNYVLVELHPGVQLRVLKDFMRAML